MAVSSAPFPAFPKDVRMTVAGSGAAIAGTLRNGVESVTREIRSRLRNEATLCIPSIEAFHVLTRESQLCQGPIAASGS
jgi:hypothetical protein